MLDPFPVDVPIYANIRGGPRAAATAKMERFVIIVNDFQPLTIITKRFILHVAARLDTPLNILQYCRYEPPFTCSQ